MCTLSGLIKCARPTLLITTRFWELIALHLKRYGCPLRFLCLWTPTPAIHSVPGSWRNDLIPSLMGPKALTSSPASPPESINVEQPHNGILLSPPQSLSLLVSPGGSRWSSSLVTELPVRVYDSLGSHICCYRVCVWPLHLGFVISDLGLPWWSSG